MQPPHWQRAYIGIGANLDDPESGVRRAIDSLRCLTDVKLVKCSSLYRTAPVGYLDQPDFVNAVVELETALEPHTLLAQLHSIERQFGRKRTWRNAPRTLDLDLLLYGDRQMKSENLTLPHPRMAERAFVLVPLTEIAPEVMVGGAGTASELLQAVSTEDVERLDDTGSNSTGDLHRSGVV
ncbi:MAG: 2-amino-4-hydroxy-6-hydroxymethyldihydropteridine diphosphokinase [Betaproteobacteria bacterium]|nr:MAG: 2-amino-4-hydroxy-6-hydroxymethyldihydropteridine diphosphokinase [Betaproteobacteria bacterium]